MTLELSPADLSRPLDHAAQRAVDRAMSDLRRGEPVVLSGADGRAVLALAAEAVTAPTLAALAQLAGTQPQLAVTGRRARTLGFELEPTATVLMTVPGGLTADLARDLADPSRRDPVPPADGRPPRERARRAVATATDATGAEAGAVLLAKLARLLPAAVLAPLPGVRDAGAFARRHDLLAVDAASVEDYRRQSARTLYRVVEATVPLEDAERTRIVAFRPSDGGAEHMAIVIGDPPPGQPVLARIHSECFTGDLLGSLRCDCGPQLRGAIAEIAKAGSGVLLYLAQEGRGIGLVNKLRAYRLQDGGLDTLDANEALGFEQDERVYLPAAAMLRALGHGAVRLMTNNPDKLAQLAACGITVVERVPHIFPSNGHNEAYIRAKTERGGHLF